MDHIFSEVFEGIGKDFDGADLILGAPVRKILLSEKKDRLTIYIGSDREISRGVLSAATEAVRRDILSGKSVCVDILVIHEAADIRETGDIPQPEISTDASEAAVTRAPSAYESPRDINRGRNPAAGEPAETAAGEPPEFPETAPESAPIPESPPGKAPSGRPKTKVPRTKRKPENPHIIYGRDFEGDPVPIRLLNAETGTAVVSGHVFGPDEIVTKNGRHIFSFNLTDGTDSIGARLFADADALEKLRSHLTKGVFIELLGTIEPPDRFHDELSIGRIKGIRKPEETGARKDTYDGPRRIELNLHTKMSEMDGIGDISDYIRLASDWGWKAIAVTDNDSVQAFPEAARLCPPGSDMKIIYGVTGHLVDDRKNACKNPRGQKLDGEFVVFDIETTGFSMEHDLIIEIGAVRTRGGRITDRFEEFVNPHIPIPERIKELTSITDEDVRDAQGYEEILPRFLEFVGDAPVVGHNVSFDVGFIRRYTGALGMEFDPTVVDTLGLSHMLLKNLYRNRLDNIAKELSVPLSAHHRAVADAEATAQIFLRFCTMLSGRGIKNLDELYEADEMDLNTIRKLHPAPFTLLAQNDLGRTNLYRLLSAAHVDYLYGQPRMPRSVVGLMREGLIIGSGSEEGDFFDRASRGISVEELAEEAKFYDYLEIVPPSTITWLIDDDSSPVRSMEDIREIERKISSAAILSGKPLVASGNTHFVSPGDERLRKIVKYFSHTVKGRHFHEQKYDAGLYLRTTDEMLSEFSFLGEERAFEAVVEAPLRIAAMVEPIAPVRPDKCPPALSDSDTNLSDTCYRGAEAMYGSPLPETVRERLDKELSSIIENGYSVMYTSAEKIVADSVAHGYLVGSRGSVGSSFAATASGISEINPLPPHYRCPGCGYSDFDSDVVKMYSERTGYDLPDALCPHCGEPLIKDGFNIPFETFLGFEGEEKEPDIDLNVAGEYQARAHAFTEELFGAGQTYKAGTIGTVQEKTALGYVLRYFDDHPSEGPIRRAEVSRLVDGIVGIKRTTGQHPGGIIVLPRGEEIYTFTPVQYPANNAKNMVTTHFDFHSIDRNLLKLDILGKDDPSMARLLFELTGLDPMNVPIGTPEVMSLFEGTSELHISPEDIGGTRLGTLGIPEFNTDFAMQMLLEAKPKYVSDLVRITGLAHGTDVWVGNAEKLIREGTCTIDTAICTRDDIMLNLIGLGLSPEESFEIMELVRRGRFKKSPDHDRYCAAMKEKGVSDWYITSLETISYLFPKAHAAAYVVMVWRIAYYKVHYPLEYYAAYFSIKGKGFDYEKICVSLTELRDSMRELTDRTETRRALSDDERLLLRDMRVAEEMMARGFRFAPIDIFRASADRFIITKDRRLMPSIDTISGLGEVAAKAIEKASGDGPYLSIEDFIGRTRVSKTGAALLKRLGLLKDLPEMSQLSFFDLVT